MPAADDKAHAAEPGFGRARRWVAITAGLLLCIAFWTATAFVYYIAGLGDISDSYLPVGVLFFLLLS